MTIPRGPIGGVFAELRRRRVLRTLALYVVGAWGLMQVADVLLPALSLPETAIRYLLFAAIAGLPVVLIFGWFFDITSEGVQRTAAASDAELEESLPLRGLDYLLLAALLLVLGVIAYGLSDAVMDLPEQASAPAGSSEERDQRAARDPGVPPMVGVLPFANIGSGDDGDLFAGGVHDDLLTLLAKIGGMRVVSRTSVLGYAGTTKKIPEIGRELRADAILEGGVRVAGELIRINAQLIDARSDEHLWAETYDRELTATNIFAVQSEIARAIAAALKTALTPEESNDLAQIPTDNLAAYRAYHEVMQWRSNVTLSMNAENRQRYRDGLRRAFELDPRFTRPMLELVLSLAGDIYFKRGEGTVLEVESLIERIGEVAPDSADYYAAQSAYFYYVLRDFDRAEALLVQAIRKSPSDTRLINIRSWINRRQGDFEAWLEASRIARDLDPRNQRLNSAYISRLLAMHRYDEAARELATVAQPGEQDRLNSAVLRVREDHDLQRYAQDVADILKPLEELSRPQQISDLWNAQIDAGDVAGAQRTVDHLLEILNQRSGGANDQPLKYVPFDLSVILQHAMFTGDAAGVRAAVAEIKRVTALEGISPENYPTSIHPMNRAALAIAEGSRDVAIDLASAYWQDPSLDRADWLGRRHGVCQMLGFIGAAEESVACLRNLFDEPSFAHPFHEPLLPTYDPVRDTPQFRALVTELVSAGWLPESG